MDNKIHFSVNIDKSSNTPIYIQLYTYIREEIINNRFVAQSKLPSIREACSILNISKTTVENTYNQLLVEGYIENVPKKGYFISNISDYQFSRELPQSKLRNKPIRTEGVYFNNAVDKDSFDVTLWKKIYTRIITDVQTNIYSTGSIQGEYELRKEISDFVNNLRGGNTRPEQVIIGAGIQYLLGILTGIIRSSYKTVAIEVPGYKKAEYIFEDYMYQIRHIPVEDDGMNIEKLSQSDARLIYTCPSHQYPLGSVMPINKRMELLNWASGVNGLIIEDDYDGIIRYDGMPIPSLQGLDKNDCVIYLGSFSKTVLPSLRISYMIIPNKLIPMYEQIKFRYTQSTSKIDQLVLANFIKDGYMTKHLRKIRRIYKKKNSLITGYISSQYGDVLNIVSSNSGFHLVCEMKTTKDIQSITNACKKNNILIEVIEKNDSRILFSVNYSGVEDTDIEKFIDKLVGMLS